MLENRTHPPLFGVEPWPGHLTVEYVELLAQDQQLEVFGPRGATPEQEQAKDLWRLIAARRKAMSHCRRATRGTQGSEKCLVGADASGGTVQVTDSAAAGPRL
jgi:hypothetical protein